MRLCGTAYYIAFSSTYAVGFLEPQLVTPLSTLMILWSYLIIIKKRSATPVVALLIYARAMVGFSANGNANIYLIMNILVNYFPSMLLTALTIRRRNPLLEIRRYAASYIYGGVLVFYSVLGGAAALAALGSRLLPFFMLLIHLLRREEKGMEAAVRQLLRWMIIISISVTFIPTYSDLATELLRGGTVYGVESLASVNLGLSSRALGPVWDPRIFGVLCFLNLALALSMRNSPYRSVDTLLSIAGIAASLSRGSIVAALILLAFVFLVRPGRVGLLIVTMGSLALVTAWDTLISFSMENIFFVNNLNPIEQRSSFFEYAYHAFLENPLGQGVGTLKNISNSVSIGDASYTNISDAYIAILLAEVGIIGFSIFLLSFWQIFIGKNKYSPAVFIALVVQMTGTDIPDFGPPYLAILLIGILNAKIETTPDCKSHTRPSPRRFLRGAPAA